MKKIQIILMLIFANLGCKKMNIQKEYDKINIKWEVKSTTGFNDIVSKNLKYIDLSICKPKRKNLLNDSAFCMGIINETSLNGNLRLNYRILNNQTITIKDVFYFNQVAQGVTVQQQITNIEKQLSTELNGDWVFEIKNNEMKLIKDTKILDLKSYN